MKIKANIANIAVCVGLVVLEVCMTGCVYSYYRIVNSCFLNEERCQYVGNDAVTLCTLWQSSERRIFYPRDFSFSTPRGDGDWFYLFIKEPICRIPTVFIEIPFGFLNRRFQEVPILINLPKGVGLHSDNNPYGKLACYGSSVQIVTNTLDKECLGIMMTTPVFDNGGDLVSVDMTYRRESNGTNIDIPLGVGPLWDWIYFTGPNDCYVLSEINKYSNYSLSVFGIIVHEDYEWPLSLLWHLDLRTGERKRVAWFDNGTWEGQTLAK